MFTYTLSSLSKLTLILRPNGTFDNIEIKIKKHPYTYFNLFLDAIKEMKAYRKGRVH